jgi:hypothetical protein
MRLLAVCLCVALFVAAAFAQGDRGSVTGTVSDPARAIIPNAAVSIRNLETGSQYQTVTTETGNYTLPQLPSGTYELVVEAAGFSKYVQQGIRVQIAQTARIDIVLQVGSTSDSVTVSADAPLLRTEGAEQSHNIRTELIDSLPLNFGARGPGSLRNPFTFVQILPGARIEGRNEIRVNGTPTRTFGILLEGQDLSRPMGPENSDMVAPSVEAVQEIAVQTSNYAAEYGQVAGGLFNFTTKSGSNAFHGSAYEYLLNEAFAAGLPFTDNGQGEHIRPTNRKHDFGGSLGGPVWIPKVYNGRDRTFFFFNYEKYIDRRHYSGAYATVPTADFRNGNFGAVLTGKTLNTDPLGRPILENTIYDPNTTRTQNGARVRDPFQNNIIPIDRFDPIALKIQNMIPIPSRGGQINNFEQVGNTERLNEITSVKIDHSFGPTSKISFYDHYYRAKFGNNGADGLPAPLTALRKGLARTHTIRFTYDHSLSPTMLLHLGAGVVRERVPDEGIDGVLLYDARTELPLVGAVGPGFPRITGLTGSLGGMSLGMGPTNAQVYYNDKPSGVVSATWVRSNHTFKAGIDWHRDIYTNQNRGNTYGSYVFSNQQTVLPSTQGQNLAGGNVGYAYASFLLGLASSSSVSNIQDPQYRKDAWAVYVQDTWKLTRKLTLDYGLRWDYMSSMRELWYRMSAFDPNRPNPAAGNLLGATSYEGNGPGRCNCRFAPTYPYAIGPRMGLAYQLASKTVLRGGFGITYHRTADFAWMGATVGVGYNTLNFDSPSFGDPAVALKTGMRYDPNELYAASFDPGIRPRTGQIDNPSNLVDHNAGRPPRITQWSLGLQREIMRDLVVEATYVGNRGAWFEANSLVDLNALTTERIQSFGLDINSATDRSLLISRLDSSTAAARGFNKAPYASYSMANTVAQSLRPYPQFGSVPVRWAPLGRTWYDALQMKATKRFSHGLEFTSAFTWQKELSMMGATGTTNNVFNRDNQKSLDGSSQPFVFVSSLNYQVPKFGPNRYVRAILGDWTLSGIVRYSSGTLIVAPSSNNQLNSLLFRGTRFNRVNGEPLFTKDPNCRECFDPRKEFVLNPKAWSDAAAGQWGTGAAYYDDYRWARQPDEQFSFGRTFRMRESMSLHVRMEFFNIFNRMLIPNTALTSANPAATQVSTNGVPISGFGRVETATGSFTLTSGMSNVRNGQLVMRLQF